MTELLGHTAVGHGPEGVIALHDWASDQTNWRSLHPFVDEARFTYLFADVRGYGASRELAPEFSAAAIARDVLALADERGWTRFHIVGHSMTGLVPQYLALRHSDRLASATAITPLSAAGVPPDPELANFFFQATTDDDVLGALHGMAAGNAYGPAWARMKTQQTRAATTAEVLQGYMALFQPSFLEELRSGRPKTPLLVVTGSRDMELFLRANLEEPLIACFEHATVHTVESGHFPMLEVPVRTAEILEAFLSEHAS